MRQLEPPTISNRLNQQFSVSAKNRVWAGDLTFVPTRTESFFSSLKNELVRRRQFQNQAEAQVAITKYIERFCNCERVHQALGDRSPEEFEQQESGA